MEASSGVSPGAVHQHCTRYMGIGQWVYVGYWVLGIGWVGVEMVYVLLVYAAKLLVYAANCWCMVQIAGVCCEFHAPCISSAPSIHTPILLTIIITQAPPSVVMCPPSPPNLVQYNCDAYAPWSSCACSHLLRIMQHCSHTCTSP